MKIHPTQRPPSLWRLLLLLPLLLSWRLAGAASEDPVLVAIAAAQPALAEQAAKNYLFLGTDSFITAAEQQLRDAVKELKENHAQLKANIQQPESMQLLGVVDNAIRQIDALAAKPFNIEGGGKMLDFSEVIREEGGNIARLLAGKANPTVLETIELQRMHNARIAKFYLAQQLGVGGAGSAAQLSQALADFEQNLGALRSAQQGNAAATAELQKVERVYKSARKLMTDDKGGRLARVVLISSDNITGSLDRIQTLNEGSGATMAAM